MLWRGYALLRSRSQCHLHHRDQREVSVGKRHASCMTRPEWVALAGVVVYSTCIIVPKGIVRFWSCDMRRWSMYYPFLRDLNQAIFLGAIAPFWTTRVQQPLQGRVYSIPPPPSTLVRGYKPPARGAPEYTAYATVRVFPSPIQG